MEVTEFGIVTLVRPLQRQNASSPMEVTEFPIVTLLRPVQRENAIPPMEVTEFGIVMLVRPLQPKNALLPMEVTVLGITVFLHPTINVLEAVSIMALQLPRESNEVLSLATVKLLSPLQLENARSPMEVTEFGISTPVRPPQP